EGSRSAGREQIGEQTDGVHRAKRQDLEIGAADRARGAELGNRRGRFGEIHDEDARERPLADLSQGGFERRFEGQVVVELLITDASLDPVEGRLILRNGDDAFAIRLLRGRRRGGDGGGWSKGCAYRQDYNRARARSLVACKGGDRGAGVGRPEWTVRRQIGPAADPLAAIDRRDAGENAGPRALPDGRSGPRRDHGVPVGVP